MNLRMIAFDDEEIGLLSCALSVAVEHGRLDLKPKYAELKKRVKAFERKPVPKEG